MYAGVCNENDTADGTNAFLSSPVKLILDVKNPGHVFISERAGPLKSMRISDQNVTTLWNGEEGCLWMIQEPTTGNLFAACRSFVGLFTGNGTLMIIAGSPLVNGFQDGSFKNSLFNKPVGMTFLDSETLIVTGFENDRLRVLDLRTNTTFSICSGTEGYDDGNLTSCQLAAPYTVQKINNTIYVGDYKRIKSIKCEWKLKAKFQLAFFICQFTR